MSEWNDKQATNGQARQDIAVLWRAFSDSQKQCEIYRGKVDVMERQLWTLRVWGGILVFLATVVAGPVVTALLIRLVLR